MSLNFILFFFNNIFSDLFLNNIYTCIYIYIYILFDSFLGIEEFMKTGLFQYFPQSADEEEHSIELHLPFLHKVSEEYVYVLYSLYSKNV